MSWLGLLLLVLLAIWIVSALVVTWEYWYAPLREMQDGP